MRKYIPALAIATLFAGAAMAQTETGVHKKILVEEFTTERCSNCPRLVGWINSAMQKDDYKEDVIVVCHHAGFGTDWLTKYFHEDYLWFYNDGGRIYAPAMMVDRRTKGGITPVKNFTSQSSMELEWMYDLCYDPKVSVEISAKMDTPASNSIDITVSGYKTVETVSENPCITVWIVEDDVPAVAQAGGGAGFIHNHVSRAVNTSWGAPLEFDGDNYTYTCTLALDPSWEKRNLKVVAAIGNYTTGRPAECPIFNCEELSYPNFTILDSRVDALDADNSEAQYFTLSGIRVNRPEAPGVYIEKTAAGSRKILVK